MGMGSICYNMFMKSLRLLNGGELAGFIKERQAKEVRALKQAWGINPKLAIVLCTDNPVIATYIKLKQRYGEDLLVDVDVHKVEQSAIPDLLKQLNADTSVHGIIVQLPLEDPSQTEELVNLVAPEKDVDALGVNAIFDPATPMAIMWLLAGYNVDLRGKQILLVGRGKLVGAPLEKMMLTSDLNVQVIDSKTSDLAAAAHDADVIITATGSAGIVDSAMVKPGTVVVDAGVASENGKTVGDVADDLFERDDIVITPRKGGVGPLTVCALFDNVIRAARLVADTQTETVEPLNGAS
jgi:methylenetetrahydrofolate dehydrogenase (NADP+)/methenyltetrahydrofolate cyclohydrolase